jgi:threonyl-tRNA synthetase
MQKVPYLLVVGKREAEAGQAALRERAKGDRGAIPVEDIIREMRMAIERKS